MPYQIVGIGEILWDVFPDGPRFGGAPANFACSAAELAGASARVLMVSAVGSDVLGTQAFEALQRRGVLTSAVQVNPRVTGNVSVELDGMGVASYRFAENTAWDDLQWSADLETLASHCDAVCFGTLGQRDVTSRHTIRSFVQAVPVTSLRILDVNLRAPYFDDELILESLALANVLKLNDEELPKIRELTACQGDPLDTLDTMHQLAQKYNLRCVALTRGEQGAILLADQETSERSGVQVDVADTVGAGDAFTASMTLDLLRGRPLDEINRSAIATASFVCSHPGATMPFPKQLRRTGNG